MVLRSSGNYVEPNSTFVEFYLPLDKHYNYAKTGLCVNLKPIVLRTVLDVVKGFVSDAHCSVHLIFLGLNCM